MIARPIVRPRPIAFTAPAHGAHAPRPVSWATSSGPASQAVATVREPAEATYEQAAHEAMSVKPACRPVAQHSAPQSARGPSQHPAVSPAQTRTNTTAKAQSELRARYIGQGALSVRSSVTGRHYRFQGHGDSLKIDKHDMLMLKRISDLIVG
ncbi:MAG: hypothetical protein EPO09_08875 [Aquabacterium sp.]|uniref:hypothetical protein n=1 Tax=Aquabacterium sp. TaxID=1872578 RepID=UPI001212EBFD|nr:hypothetical protein [Aquabacterium sp.]TAK94814.1 MAG: hypothetical protein EPO09_08875 [Aquabacterium sp.]